MSFISKSINHKLLCMFILIALVPLVVVSIFGLTETIDTLKQEAVLNLKTAREEKAIVIYDYFNNIKKHLLFLSHQKDIIRLITGEKAADAGIHQSDNDMNLFLKTYDFPGMAVVKAKNLELASYADMDEKQAMDLVANPAVRDLCQKALKTRQTQATDYMQLGNSKENNMYAIAPVSYENKVIGLILLQLNKKHLDKILQTNLGLGDNGEVTLIGKDRYTRSNCRFSSEDTLKKIKLDAPYISKALNGENLEDIVVGPHKWNALISCAPLSLKKETGFDLDWAILAECSEKEIMAPINHIFNGIVVVAVLAVVGAIVCGILAARSVASPVSRLTRNLQLLAEGDLTVERLPVTGKDELSKMTNSFNTMLDTLRNQVQQMQSGVQELSAAIAQIGGAIAELAANSAETSTSVTEISTTMEEVKQTSHMASEKAQNVAEMTLQVNEVSKEGINATMESVDGMNHIKEEMGSLADSIIKLSDQTQSISDIISAVGDIAEQSNLLAVNAAIEAAKAGEFGKGFAVVAQEVKSLSEQSKNSTRQVNGILNEIQKATSSAVMATERGSKAVDSGVKLSEAAGSAIKALSENISNSSRAASQISASSRQQLSGIDQLAIALESIKEATQQNISGVEQLEQAVESIRTLSEDIREMTGQFKIN